MSSIKEVARLAGVSPSTVSRVMNGTANVCEEKKKRVEEMILKTGFKPNEIARSLFKKSSHIIGFILPNITNPFFGEISRAIEETAYRNGYRLILCNSDEDFEKEMSYIEVLTSMNADGIILTTNKEHLKEKLENCKIPIVLLDRISEDCNVVASVQADHYQGEVLAVEHLIECGCKKIVHMRGPQLFSSAVHRWNGYLQVCQKYNIETNFIDCKYDYEDGLIQSELLLKKFPDVDGILASNDMVALALYKVILKKGLTVPHNIQIVGFDNIGLSSMAMPEMTTIAQPMIEMGNRATQIIIDLVEGKELEKKDYFLKTKLIKRDTTLYLY